ncbi:MAG: hypothetical protein K9H16_16355, partial [Bacteroidales bacterium]|nr:hypothetical protein [Bacteroidales bacterium]
MKKYFLLFALIAVLFTACNTSVEKQEQKAEKAESGKALTSNVEHPGWSKNANIYEVNIRQFSKEGTIGAFMKQLPRLKNMGV